MSFGVFEGCLLTFCVEQWICAVGGLWNREVEIGGVSEEGKGVGGECLNCVGCG